MFCRNTISVTFAILGVAVLAAQAKDDVRTSRTSTSTPAEGIDNKALSLVGHTGRVVAVAFALDGQLVLSGSWDGTIRKWSREKGKEVQRFEIRKGRGTSVAFSWNGKQAAYALESLSVLDLGTGKTVCQRPFEHRRQCTDIAFTSDGQAVFVSNGGFYDPTITLFNALTGELIRQLEPEGRIRGSSTGMIISPGGSTLFTSASHQFEGADRRVRAWRIADGRERWRSEKYSGYVLDMSVSPDGKYLVSANPPDGMYLWNASNGALIRRMGSKEKSILSVVFCANNRHVVSGTEGYADVWDVLEGKRVKRYEVPHRTVSCLAVSSDGQFIAAGTWPALDVMATGIPKQDYPVYIWRTPSIAKSLRARSLRSKDKREMSK